MITLYAAALRWLGLSQADAADLHSVRLDTMKSWCSGRREVPDFAWNQLREIADHRRAWLARALTAEELRFATENEEAWRIAGFPTADSFAVALVARELTP